MDFEEECQLSNGIIKEWHGSGMVCLIPKEHILETFEEINSCEDIGATETNNNNLTKNNPYWLNMAQFGTPHVSGLCKIREKEMKKLNEIKSFGLLRLQKTAVGYIKKKREWNSISSNKKKEELFLKAGGKIYEALSTTNYISGMPLFYTESHEGQKNGKYFAPTHTHINFEGNQEELYETIKPLLDDAKIKSTIYSKYGRNYRIKIWTSKYNIPSDIKQKIYKIIKEKYPDVRVGTF